VQGDGRLAAGLRAVDLDHPPAWQAADAERDVERDRAGRDDLDRRANVVAQAHDGTLAETLLDLPHHAREGAGLLILVGLDRHDDTTFCSILDAPTGDPARRKPG
jgi:hypothetical protein